MCDGILICFQNQTFIYFFSIWIIIMGVKEMVTYFRGDYIRSREAFKKGNYSEALRLLEDFLSNREIGKEESPEKEIIISLRLGLCYEEEKKGSGKTFFSAVKRKQIRVLERSMQKLIEENDMVSLAKLCKLILEKHPGHREAMAVKRSMLEGLGGK